jgi:hypothetical protein
MGVESASPHLSAEARFQDAYARFLTDQAFRELVLRPSASSGSVTDLSRTDIDRLRAMDQSRVELFAQCLFTNRLAAVAEAFPLSFKVMGSAVPALVHALDLHDVAIDTRKYAEAARFADFVLNDGDPRARGLSGAVLGLLRYELILLNLRVRPQLPAWPQAAIHSAEALGRALTQDEDVVLVLNLNHALLGVNYDVEVLRDLAPDVASFAAAEADIIVLLHRDENGVVHEKRLNHASAAAILMIDGTGTFRSLVAAYAVWLNRASDVGLEDGLKELCVSLCACGALCFKPAVADAGKTTCRPTEGRA